MRKSRAMKHVIASVDHTSPMAGLEHLKSKISYDGIRYYDIAAGPEMYPRYERDERARFDPRDKNLEGAFDVVLHLTNGDLIVRGFGAITKTGVGTYYFLHNDEMDPRAFVNDIYPRDQIVGVYRISSRIAIRHYPDYQR